MNEKMKEDQRKDLIEYRKTSLLTILPEMERRLILMSSIQTWYKMISLSNTTTDCGCKYKEKNNQKKEYEQD